MISVEAQNKYFQYLVLI